ncbi:MAG: DUF3810 domain-containing protein [Ruminococcaceae bacterium]|nr:DUF3810 domain-containing protein [Oscillospiraceae bacterium]
MKQHHSPQKTPSAEPLSPISATDYAALPKEQQAAYRPVSPSAERLPKICIVFYGVALLSLAVYIICSLSPDFADFFNQNISVFGRSVLNLLTAWVPFSLGEFCIFMLPLVGVFSLVYAFRRRCDTWKSALTYLGILLSAVSLLFSLFALNFAPGYRGRGLDEKLGLDRHPVSADELYETAEILRKEVNALTEDILYTSDGFSVMPYSLNTLSHKLNESYAAFCTKLDFITHVNGTVKPVLVSEAMSYMHITGVYSFFTGEANLNVNFPDYTLPFTAAHEMAHQRGIAREDEANFMAFLICTSSDDPYIRYSGYLNMYEYVAGALSSASHEQFSMVSAHLNAEVKKEMSAYNQFFKTYANSTASKVSGTVNNSFLQSQGTPGTKSYGMVVDLAVAFYQQAP